MKGIFRSVNYTIGISEYQCPGAGVGLGVGWGQLRQYLSPVGST